MKYFDEIHVLFLFWLQMLSVEGNMKVSTRGPCLTMIMFSYNSFPLPGPAAFFNQENNPKVSGCFSLDYAFCYLALFNALSSL